MSGGTFLSYARENGEFALRLGRDLKAAGVDVWIDQLAITGGELWDHAVQEALEGCSTLVIVLSPDAIKSRSVMDEVAFALDEGKRVVPVVLQPCKTPFRLRRVQYVDFTADYARGLSHLTALLATLARTPPPPKRASGELRRSQPGQGAFPEVDKEAAGRAAADRALREQQARERAEPERQARGKAEREGHARREREAGQEAEATAARLEAAEQLKRERSAREAREREESARRERDAAERAAKEAAQREARGQALQREREQEAAARETQQAGEPAWKHVGIGLGLLAAVIMTLIVVVPRSRVPTLERLTVTPESLAMSVGDLESLRLEGGYSDGSSSPRVMEPVVWASSDTALVTVDILGNVRALAPGRAIVTASTSSLEAAAVVAVDRPAPSADRSGATPGRRRPAIEPTAVSTTGAIRGTVRDNLGQPVSALVLVAGSGQPSLANAQGAFTFTGIPPGTWPVVARYIGYATETTMVRVTAGAAATANLTLRPVTVQADIPVVATGTIRGSVRNASSAPVAGAQVAVVGSQLVATTSAEGYYTLTGVPEGMSTVRIRAIGYRPETTTVAVVGGRTVTADVTVRQDALSLDEAVVRLPQAAHRISLRFLESTDSGRTGRDRSQVFDAASTLWVMPYVTLEHAPARVPATETMRCTKYPPGGGAAQTIAVILTTRAGEARTLGWGVWGRCAPGAWLRGRHRVECSWLGSVIATGSFEVR